MRPWLYVLTAHQALRCNCGTLSCFLDAVLLCKSRRICDRHDAYILNERAA